MNNKNILGIVTGALLMGIAMAIVAYVYTDFGTSNFWELVAIYFGIYGIIIGGFAGVLITKYDFNFIGGTVFGLLFTAAVGFILIFFMGNVENEFYYVYYASVIIGMINGAIISLINRWQQQLK